VRVQVPLDLPSALSRIAELEDSEYRLKTALQEAMAAIEMKNKVLEDTAQYVETLEAELQCVSFPLYHVVCAVVTVASVVMAVTQGCTSCVVCVC
jgi:hypothetical protein